jgi:predicted 3-demethylubiquinone-9 3-methyltransferase (glyoxalase superfamily)
MAITPFLMFNDRADEAIEFYTSIFENSKRLGHMEFELEGQRLLAMSGGPTFKFSTGISMMVSRDTQAEIDYLWERLTQDGEEGRCGWLTDKFGMSWQIIPSSLGEFLGHADPERAARAQQALMGMSKLNIADFEAAVA